MYLLPLYSLHSELLARARMAELARAGDHRVKRRSSLRIMIDARRARQQSPVR
jgi:hypothetical protein